MSDYAWRIDKDHIPAEGALPGTNSNAPGVTGPSDAPEKLLVQLDLNEGQKFYIYDDDGVRYYEGRIVGDYEGFEPLDDFGAPNAGATDIRYRSIHEHGAWRSL